VDASQEGDAGGASDAAVAAGDMASRDDGASDGGASEADLGPGEDAYVPPPACELELPTRPGALGEMTESGSRELVSGGTEQFASIAHIDSSGACSDDYSRIDFCANRANPPAPSITRRVGVVRPFDGSDGTAPARADGAPEPSSYPRAGDGAVLPFLRSSTDGRVLLDGRYRTWPHLFAHRPEAYEADFRLAGARAAASDVAAELHMLAWFDPTNTSFTVSNDTSPSAEVTSLLGSVDTLHSTLCESSSTREAGGRRNPTPCTARYGDFAYDGAAPSGTDLEVKSGVCYRLSFLAGVEDEGHWELRSSPLTIFVENSHKPTTERMWVYPENPGGAWDRPDERGVVSLPDYADYDLGRLFPWNRVQGDMNVLGAVTSESVDMGHALPVPARCWQRERLLRWQRAEGAPAWCDFLYGQKRASTFAFDTNRNAIAERPSTHPSAEYKRWAGERSSNQLFELITTGDGRVLFVNQNDALYYTVNRAGPCRADGFDELLPISLIPVDPQMLPSASHPGYGLATVTGGRPYTDPSGREIPLGSLHHFAYPWVDRAGANLFFSMVNEQRDAYFPSSFARVPTDARVPNGTITPEPNQEAEQAHRITGMNTRAAHQIGFVGAWSQGRFVVVDNLLNASDLGGLRAFGRSDATGDIVQYDHEYSLPLYRDRTLAFSPRGASVISSFENQFAMFDAFRPRLPFDVVWAMTGNNQTTSELAFDDFMDRRAWAVVPMNASLRFYDTISVRSPAGASLVAVEDGFMAGARDRWTDRPNFEFNLNDTRAEQPSARPILQNAAPLSPVNRVRLRGGARIEPVALGGVLGRGVYLDGKNDFADLGYPLESHHDWYVGAWFEPRQASHAGDRRRELFHFADGSYVGLLERAGRYDLLVSPRDSRAEQVVGTGDFIVPGRFVHLGVRLSGTATSRTVELFVNGSSVGRRNFVGSAPSGLSLMASCEIAGCSAWSWMALGRPDSGLATTSTFDGWVDELKVYRLRPEDVAGDSNGFNETACNFALGTLARSDALYEAAERHRTNTGAVPPELCEQLAVGSLDRPHDLPAQRGRTLCADSVHRVLGEDCTRPAHFGLPSLHASAPRPSTASNAFCLTCHTSANAVTGLRTDALAASGIPRARDARRQPLDPPAVIGLPPFECPDSSLRGTFYTSLLRANPAPRADGSWLVDPVIDERVLGPFRYFPPGP
jgi:hypothetical protein